MKEIESSKGIPGLLRSFKKYIIEENLPSDSQIVFYGCPGTCLPFAELITYAIRDLPVTTAFVPYLEEKNAFSLKMVEKLGAQADKPLEKLNPRITVIMGGIAMPKIPVTAKDANKTISKYNSKKIGICFMSILQSEGWTDEIDFDMVIDTTVDPVKIYR